MVNAEKNKIVFKPKKMIASQSSQSALKGMVTKSKDTMPVPIVTENQDGEKLRTTRRQPTSYLVNFGGARETTESLDGVQICVVRPLDLRRLVGMH